jgi:hypothetical protein
VGPAPVACVSRAPDYEAVLSRASTLHDHAGGATEQRGEALLGARTAGREDGEDGVLAPVQSCGGEALVGQVGEDRADAREQQRARRWTPRLAGPDP